MPAKTRLRNDLLCVEWDVKPYTLTHSLTEVMLCLCVVKATQGEVNRTVNNADVAADDVDTLSGLLEAVALLMMGVQTALEKVRFT